MLYISGALFSLAIPNCHPEVYTYGCVCVERLLEVAVNQRASFWAFGFSAVGDFKTQGIQFAKPQNISDLIAPKMDGYDKICRFTCQFFYLKDASFYYCGAKF